MYIYHYHGFYREGPTTIDVDGILNWDHPINDMQLYREAKEVIASGVCPHRNLVLASLTLLHISDTN